MSGNDPSQPIRQTLTDGPQLAGRRRSAYRPSQRESRRSLNHGPRPLRSEPDIRRNHPGRHSRLRDPLLSIWPSGMGLEKGLLRNRMAARRLRSLRQECSSGPLEHRGDWSLSKRCRCFGTSGWPANGSSAFGYSASRAERPFEAPPFGLSASIRRCIFASRLDRICRRTGWRSVIRRP